MMQAGKDYGVEVITAYEFRRVGQVFYPPGLLRDALVKRGLVRRLDGPQASPPSPAIEAPATQAASQPTSAAAPASTDAAESKAKKPRGGRGLFP